MRPNENAQAASDYVDHGMIKMWSNRYLGVNTDDYNDEKYLDYLETLIATSQTMAVKGEELFPDSIYDTAMELLKALNPNSPLITNVWSEDDNSVVFDENIDKYLPSNPMMSINTIKDINDKGVQDFIDRLPDGVPVTGFASLKENGHGIRIVMKGNEVIRASSRGRSTNGRDITKQLKLIIGQSGVHLDDDIMYELRGELLLPFSNLDTAKTFKSDIKSAFTGVASMIRESATTEETQLLRFVAYDVIASELSFNALSEKFAWLQNHGFEVPMHAGFTMTKENAKAVMSSCVEAFAKQAENYDYYTDGVVFGVDNIEIFNNMGSADKYRYGNVALKIGRWKQDLYTGRVIDIKWVNGKSKLTPVARVCDPDNSEVGVMTATGNTVSNVPLYAPCYILMLEAYPNNLINFKYGGEAGVVPCTPDGLLVTDKDAMRPLANMGSDDVDFDPFYLDDENDSSDAISY